MANSITFNTDCLPFMKQCSDKEFDLAIVDPPYGIEDKIQYHENGTAKNRLYAQSRWDSAIPSAEYFQELQRISKNQIIWGGNYFAHLLPPSRGWIFWQKFSHNNKKYSHGELAWTSFDRKLEMIKYYPDGISHDSQVIHPTQKPIFIYDWLLINFSKVGDKIIDTHLGSGGSRIACEKAGLDFVGCERDVIHYQNQEKRFKDHLVQGRLFDLSLI